MDQYEELGISEREWFSISHEERMKILVQKEENKPGWAPYVRLDCGNAWKSTRRQSENGWEENVIHSCWNCQHVKIESGGIRGCKDGQMKAPRKYKEEE